MRIVKHIPNAITCGNLFCGTLGIIATLNGNTTFGAAMIIAAAILDFFDGFAARLLKVASPIGKELDSLADVVSFGVLPGLIVYMMLSPVPSFAQHLIASLSTEASQWQVSHMFGIQLIALVIPVFSALRLAKFNIDTRQSDSFIGVPTPANAILIASFPLMLSYQQDLLSSLNLTPLLTNSIFLAIVAIVMSLLLVSELPLIALKFKNFSWSENMLRYIFIACSVILLVILKFIAVPVVIMFYILLSVLAAGKKEPAGHTK